ncbi:MAG: nitroreductase family protein, partial [Solobacterium sp.]|nr:nitroreductase family protein [Solobacterium sp.]
RCGYYGEKIVLKAQMLGLNTCWVGGTYKKIESVVDLKPGEKFLMVIAIGYGENQGREHKYKKVKDLSIGYPDLPDWFIKGVEAVAMAPSALNQHSYRFGIRDEKVYVKKGLGIALDTDIGIAKYHFEVAAGKDSSIWE